MIQFTNEHYTFLLRNSTLPIPMKSHIAHLYIGRVGRGRGMEGAIYTTFDTVLYVQRPDP